MVNLPNKDRVIFDLSIKVVDIIAEYQKNGKVFINTNSEGLCLQTAGVYQTLDYICEVFKFNKKNFIINTPNSEETHTDYTINYAKNHWIDFCKSQFFYNSQKNNELKNIGCFIGKPNWHRLIIASWIYNNKKVLLTCHYNPKDERHCIDSELTDINRNAPNELPGVVSFLPNCPIFLDEGFLNYTIGPPTHYNILSHYSGIFVDLVIETYVSGKTFFPTEKTLRPIIAKTPFIIMGPQGYLGNLKRMGFQTFGAWWDEEYDNFSGYARLQKIKKISDLVLNWDNRKLHSILDEMTNVLEHNRALLQSINGNKTKLIQ